MNKSNSYRSYAKVDFIVIVKIKDKQKAEWKREAI